MSDQEAPQLLSLPGHLLERIASESFTKRPTSLPGQPLLGVARTTRDAVLRASSKAHLILGENEHWLSARPLGRLLSPTCSLSAGPDLVIEGSQEKGKNKWQNQDAILGNLLAGGNLEGNHEWCCVTSLELRSLCVGLTSSSQVGPTFCNIHTLDLTNCHLGQGRILAGLLQCKQLARLSLRQCTLKKSEAAVEQAALLLQRLKSLRELVLEGDMPLGLTQGLTQLTSLEVLQSQSSIPQLVSSAQALHHLQHLALSSQLQAPSYPALVVQLLTSLTQLKSLDLQSGISQQELDAALTQGGLTKLYVSELASTESRANHTCSSLKAMGWCGLTDLAAWTHLPLHSMESLTIFSEEFGEHQLPGKEWWLPAQAGDGDEEELPLHMEQAVSNILQCPAWAASGEQLTLGLITDAYGSHDVVDPDTDELLYAASLYSDTTRLQLLKSLSPLLENVVHIKISMPGFVLGAAEVVALGEGTGTHLIHLTLSAVEIQRDFWPAVWGHLPALHTLTISSGCEDSVSEADLSMFCVRAPRPFTLQLERLLYRAVGGARVQEGCSLWGTTQVVVKSIHPC